MKSLQELFDEIETNDKLKNKLAEAAKSGKVIEFLKEQGCDATPEEIESFINDKVSVDSDTELDLDELDNVAGGGSIKDVYRGIKAALRRQPSGGNSNDDDGPRFGGASSSW